MGRNPTAYSIVLPVPADALAASPAFRALQAELRAAPFGPSPPPLNPSAGASPNITVAIFCGDALA